MVQFASGRTSGKPPRLFAMQIVLGALLRSGTTSQIAVAILSSGERKSGEIFEDSHSFQILNSVAERGLAFQSWRHSAE